ncbi:hypothetical protein LWI28_025482 [Acer negundo]|uniref:Cytochrome P450 n=1 Tax=Acer negundo TaxID=4023 RepID=A0AAD5J6W0_ACENE|nr:hypothetical protein LWI28_025482 [Acer negundo]
MELEFFSISIFLITFLLFVFMVLKIVKRSKTNEEKSLNLPPGPWKLPIIGNLHQLTSSLVHRQLRDMSKKYGPLMHLQLGELSTVVVSSAKFAEQVMKTHDVIFASRPVLLSTKILDYDSTSISFSPYGSYWRQLRKICVQELLTMKRVQSFRSIREEEVSSLIASISSKAGSPVNLTENFRSLIYGITSRAAFGKKSKDIEVFISAFMEALSLSAGFNIADLYPSIELLQWITGIKSQLMRIHRTMDKILEDIVKEHKSKIGEISDDENEDLVDVLLKVQKRGDLEVPLTADNVKAVILDVWIAGGETSATTLDWAMRICPGISYGLANVELPLAMLLYHFDWKLPNEMKSEDLDMTEAAGLAVRRKDELCVIPIPYRPSSI